MFFIDHTVKNDVTILGSAETKEEAILQAKEAVERLRAEGKRGNVSVYEGTGTVQRIYEVFEV